MKFNLTESTASDKDTEEKEKVKQPESIFGKMDVSNLFNNKPGEAGINLFGKPTTSPAPLTTTNFSSLFSNVKSPETTSTGLFSQPTPTTSSLFGNISAGSGLFGNLSGEKSAGLGSILNFGQGGVPPVSRTSNTAGSDEEEGDDDEGAKPENIDISKSTGTYVYDNPFTRKIEVTFT